jgi:hypothetical protein
MKGSGRDGRGGGADPVVETDVVVVVIEGACFGLLLENTAAVTAAPAAALVAAITARVNLDMVSSPCTGLVDGVDMHNTILKDQIFEDEEKYSKLRIRGKYPGKK